MHLDGAGSGRPKAVEIEQPKQAEAAEQAAPPPRQEAHRPVRQAEDAVEPAPPPSVFDELRSEQIARRLEMVRLTDVEQQQLLRSGATTLLSEDADDARANCLDQAVDVARGLSPAERRDAELVMLEDTRQGIQAQSGHVVVRQGDQVIDPANGKRYGSTEEFLAANAHYREAGTLAAEEAVAIFETPAGSPARARALEGAGVPSALRNMALADYDAGGGGGDASLAAQVKLYGPDVLPDRAGSEAAGRADGDSLREAMEAYDQVIGAQGTGNDILVAERRQVLLAEVDKVKQHAGDPAYAAALLDKVGAENLRMLFEINPRRYGASVEDPLATASGPMQEMQQQLGPLADAFYAADKSGMLSPEVRSEMLDMDRHSLSVFLRMGPQDGAFEMDAAKRILEPPSSPQQVSATHNMLLAYPDAGNLLELAADPKYAKQLLSFEALATSGGYGGVLAKQLDAALQAEPPGSPTHERAMANIIDIAQDPELRKLLSSQPELATTLAEGFTPYLEHAGWLQGQDISKNSYDSRYEMPPHDGPRMKDDVTANEIANFLGGLVNAKPARDLLQAEATKIVQTGELSKYFSDPANLTDDAILRPEFRAAMISDLSVASLLVQGAKVSDLDDEAKKAFVGMAVNTLAVGYATAILGPAGPPVEVALDPLTSPMAKKLADLVVHQNDFDSDEYMDQVSVAFGGAVQEMIDKRVGQLPPEQRSRPDSLDPVNSGQVFEIAKTTFTDAVVHEIQEMVKD
jgi:hypothetical protein